MKDGGPLTLEQIGFRLRPIKGRDGKTNVYIEPYGVRVAVHPEAKNVPHDGPFGPKKSFFLPGGIFQIGRKIGAMACLSNQMLAHIPLDAPMFTEEVQPEYRWQSQESIDATLQRNKKRPRRMLPTRVIRFPR